MKYSCLLCLPVIKVLITNKNPLPCLSGHVKSVHSQFFPKFEVATQALMPPSEPKLPLEAPFICPDCKEEFQSHESLKAHWQVSHKVPFIYYVSTFKLGGRGSKMPKKCQKSAKKVPKKCQKSAKMSPKSVPKCSKVFKSGQKKAKKVQKYAYVIYEWPLRNGMIKKQTCCVICAEKH